MTELRRRFVEDMTLHGLAPTTRNVYVNAVQQLAAHGDALALMDTPSA